MYEKICIALDQIEHCQEFAGLIPEVWSNLVYVKPDASPRDEVPAIYDRILINDHCCVEQCRNQRSSPRGGD